MDQTDANLLTSDSTLGRIDFDVMISMEQQHYCNGNDSLDELTATLYDSDVVAANMETTCAWTDMALNAVAMLSGVCAWTDMALNAVAMLSGVCAWTDMALNAVAMLSGVCAWTSSLV